MLSKEIKDRIQKEAETYYPFGQVNFETITGRNDIMQQKQLTYIAGATSWAEKAEGLVKELESIRDGYDHDEDAHRYNNLPACRVCSAEKALNNYKQ